MVSVTHKQFPRKFSFESDPPTRDKSPVYKHALAFISLNTVFPWDGLFCQGIAKINGPKFSLMETVLCWIFPAYIGGINYMIVVH